MVVPIRDLGNKFFHNSANMTLDLNTNLTSIGEIEVDDFHGGSVDNYNDMRGRMISSNKLSSRTVSISSSETSVDYTIWMERLNDLSDNEEVREPIDSSQLSYTAT